MTIHVTNPAGQGPTGLTGPTGPKGEDATLPQNIGTSDSPSFDKVYATNNGNGTNFKVGDDVWLGDFNKSNTLKVKGIQDATKGYISFGSATDKQIGGDSSGNLSIYTDLLPASDNVQSLGSDSNRFKSIHIGPGTIYITDVTLGTNAGITVDNGILQINGANQLQVGQLKFNLNKILSTTSAINIEIGSTADTATIELNRNTHIPTGKKLSFGTGRRVDVEPSLAPYGKQTVCVVTSGSKKQMYWGTCSSQGLTGDEYYVLATFTNT